MSQLNPGNPVYLNRDDLSSSGLSVERSYDAGVLKVDWDCGEPCLVDMNDLPGMKDSQEGYLLLRSVYDAVCLSCSRESGLEVFDAERKDFAFKEKTFFWGERTAIFRICNDDLVVPFAAIISKGSILLINLLDCCPEHVDILEDLSRWEYTNFLSVDSRIDDLVLEIDRLVKNMQKTS